MTHMRVLLLLLAFLACACALPGLATYELAKKWGTVYPARHHTRPRLSRVDVLEATSEELLGESRRRLQRLAERLRQQKKIDGMMDALLGVRREAAK